MATNIAPHNVSEVVAAAKYLLEHPRANLPKIMELLPAPDLPTGGTIIDLDGVREAYETGRGQFRMRAKAAIEKLPNRKSAVVVTELPMNVGPERVIARIKALVDGKKISGISRITDLTDMEQGLRLVIELKSSAEPEQVLSDLYRLTPMEESFAVNAVALVEGRPKTLGLIEMLQVFLEHRVEVVTRRSEFRRARAKDRLHLVEGLLIAILNIDKVIAVIRKSDDANAAREALKKRFKLTALQADYILETPLRRLTKLSQIEVEKEKAELTATIKELTSILGDKAKLKKVVSDELTAVAKYFGTPRRTELTAA